MLISDKYLHKFVHNNENISYFKESMLNKDCLCAIYLCVCLFDWLIDWFHLPSDLYRYRSRHSEYIEVHRVCKAFVTSQFAKQPKHILMKT